MNNIKLPKPTENILKWYAEASHKEMAVQPIDASFLFEQIARKETKETRY